MKKFRLLTLLALLMTAATGAWAAPETPLITIESKDYTSFKSGSQTFDDKVTVTFSGNVDNNGNDWGWCTFDQCTLTVTAAEGYTITGVRFSNDSGSRFDGEAPFEAILGWDANGGYFAKVNGTSIGTGDAGVTKIEVYGNAVTPASYSVTMPQDTPDASNWTGKAGTATTFSALPLENVAVGDAVTLKYSGNRKVKTVTATLLQMQSLTIAKGSTGLSGDKVLYYMPGDTYRQALARTENQSTGGLGWGYWEDSNITTLFFKEVTTKAWDVAIDGDSNFGPGKGTCNITFDTEINPTGHTFQFVESE